MTEAAAATHSDPRHNYDVTIVDPRTAIPIHYNDYEAFTSPLEEFKRSVSAAGLKDRVHYLSHGDTYEFEVSGADTGV